MLKPKPAALACLASAMVLLSCAAPKATIVAETPAPVEENPENAATAAEPAVPETPDDGIRLPDMLGLPDEGELRSASVPPGSGTPESGAVIARPPSDLPKKP
jgi:hypothetical protein